MRNAIRHEEASKRSMDAVTFIVLTTTLLVLISRLLKIGLF